MVTFKSNFSKVEVTTKTIESDITFFHLQSLVGLQVLNIIIINDKNIVLILLIY